MITEEVAKHLEQILLVWLLLQVKPARCRKLFVILTQILERYFFGKEQGYSGLRLGSAQLKTRPAWRLAGDCLEAVPLWQCECRRRNTEGTMAESRKQG